MFVLLAIISCALFADARLTPRVLNGNNAQIMSYPYQVSLDYNGAHLCGGSIISKNCVLTAAHCSNLVPDVNKLYVRAGSSFPSKGGSLHKVVKLIGHKGFEVTHDGAPVHDIAIVKVREPFQYDENCQPIKLFKRNEEAISGSKAVVTGYGLISEKEPAEQLQALLLTVVSKEACKEAHGQLPESQICAIAEFGKRPCTGDSGGPIAIDGRLAGIVSWGKPGCNVNTSQYPSVYTEVSHYHDWINEHVQF